MWRKLCLLIVMTCGLFADQTLSVNKPYNLSICAIFKNEAPYLKEWIEYHKIVGVDHFYLYNNESSDEYLKILSPYIQKGEVTLINWPNQRTQEWGHIEWAWVYTTQATAYAHAFNQAKDSSKWVAAIDIDEFMVPVKAPTLTHVLQKYETHPGLQIFWRVFGTSGVKEIPKNKLLIEMLNKKTFAHHPLNKSFKSVIKPDLYKGFTWPPHACAYTNGQAAYQADPEEIVINHYMNRSEDRLEKKIKSQEFVQNLKYSEETIQKLINVGNDIIDEEGAIRRFIPKLREAVFPKEKKIIYISPGTWGDIFDLNSPYFNRDGCLEPIMQLKQAAEKAGFEIRQTHTLNNLKDFEYLIIFEVPLNQILSLAQYPQEKLILFLWEPPSVISENYNPNYHRLFSKVYTWCDTLVDDKKYFKFFYPVHHEMIQDVVDFDSKNLCTLVACNKKSTHPKQLYSKRLELIQFFENRKNSDFAFYGRGWPKSYKTWKGPIYKKVDYLKQYKFCFAYENIKGVPGYITEKIFDCFHAGCVPIYSGASNVTSYIPKGCFIDADLFATHEELYTFLEKMPKADYLTYLENIRLFLVSDQAKLFTSDHFVQLMMGLIQSPITHGDPG